LGGVFYAVDQGLASGLSSLIVSLQPFATALLAWFVLGETLGVKRGVCFAVALIGVSMVLADGAGLSVGQQGITIENMVACLLAMVAISFGAVYQKRFVTDLNLLVSTNIQFAGAAFASFIVVLLFENGEIHWTNEVVFAMVWLVLVLSIGAVGLLMFLIRQGSSSSVASLFFLVPVVAMFMGWVLFGETLSLLQIAGSFLVIVGVAASSRIK
jgi:drug/metabolite transporter (DMT)-like permease